MATPHNATPGWYPLNNDPGTERYWDGTRWTEHHRIRQVPRTDGGGSSGGKIILGIVIGIVLLLGGCLVSSVLLVRGTVDTFEQLSEITVVEGGQPGSASNPLSFGAFHSREPGLSGSAWTVSVDEVTEISGCLVVSGRATLDSLEGERTTSLRSSFPEIGLFDEQEQLVRPTVCSRTPETTPNRFRAGNIEVEPGVEFEWFETFEVQSFRWVSVSGTVYRN